MAIRKKAAGTEGFVRRLNQACDDASDIIPAHGEGRQIELAKRMGMSQEGIRKWFAGEAMPRRGVMQKLATVLKVEEPWLALGITPEVTREGKRLAVRNVEGAVLITMGMVTLNGGICAIPGDDDPRKGYVDFYAIMRGVQMAVHVSHAKVIAPGSFEAVIPREYKEVKIFVVIPMGGNRCDFITLDSANSPAYYQRKGGAYVLHFGKQSDGTYARGEMTWKRIKNFGEIM